MASSKKSASTRVDLMEHQLKQLIKRRMQDEMGKMDQQSSINDLKSEFNILDYQDSGGKSHEGAINIQQFYHGSENRPVSAMLLQA